MYSLGIQCELKKKGNQDSITKSLKIKKTNHEIFISGFIAYLFFFHMVYWSFILGQGWLLSNHFCQAGQNCLHPSFVIVHKAIVALLWNLPQMPSCSTNNANLDKTNFDMFYKIDCCAAIHGWIWMNNVPHESRILMLSCWSLRNLESNPGFLF